MKSIFLLVFLTTLFATPAFAVRKIYLQRNKTNYEHPYTLIDLADSTYLQIVEGFPNHEGGGGGSWLVTPQFIIKPTAPDDEYIVFVDGEQKQTGWLKKGLYSGIVWQPDYYDDRWRIIEYKNGKKQGAEKIFQYNHGNKDYFLASFEWYDNDLHPVTTTYYPSGVVEHYSILDHFYITIDENNMLSSVSENGGEWRTIGLPVVKGQLDGMADWFKGGNGIGTQRLRITFVKNRLIQWEFQEAVKFDSTPVIAHYNIQDN